MSAQPKAFRAAGVDALRVKRAAVIGAGSMGSGIAAQFANAGVPVDLLDLPGEGAADRDGPARAGVARQLKARGFMHEDAVALVRTGNTEDDLQRLAEADWIVEAVIENLDVKRDLYAKIDAVRKPGSIVSSNTSTIPRAKLVELASPAFARDFVITHFFNPPRVMRLVELVCDEGAPSDLRQAVTAAAETALGKRVIDCRDTPGFIANRIGCFWMAAAAKAAIDAGLTVEEADAVNAALGIPRTGVFGLLDLIGLDLVPHVWGSLMSALPGDDRLQKFDLPKDVVIRRLIETGRLGRKTKAGFYRMSSDRRLEALDLDTLDYRLSEPAAPGALPGGGRDVGALLQADDRFGRYAWRLFREVFLYCCENGAEIAADIEAIDTAITLGYAWKKGPFRLAEAYGLERLAARLEAEAEPAPALLSAALTAGGFYTADGRPLSVDGAWAVKKQGAALADLAAARSAGAPIIENDAASLWNLGDGVACFEMHTKMNSFAPGVFDLLEQTIERGGRDFGALVVGNDDPRTFSAGADLKLFVGMTERRAWDEIEAYLARGQSLFRALRYAPFPTVGALHGIAIGGAVELMLHFSATVTHAELDIGLSEAKIGIAPGWGGCAQLLRRAQSAASGPKGPAAVASVVFDLVYAAERSSSARHACALGYLRDCDTIVMNRDHLLATAKDMARGLAEGGYAPPQEPVFVLGGASAKAGLMNKVAAMRAAGAVTDHDVRVASALADIVTGGPDADPATPVSETEIMDLERRAVVGLAQTEETQERIRHVLAHGKILRN